MNKIKEQYGEKVWEQLKDYIDQILAYEIGRARLAEEVDGITKYQARTILGYVRDNFDVHGRKDEETKHVEEDGEHRFEYKGEKSLTTKEEAVEFFDVDLEKWRVKQYECKSYDVTMKLKTKGEDRPLKRTNYAVSLKIVPRENQVDYESLVDNVRDKLGETEAPQIITGYGEKTGVAHTADFHTGAKTNRDKGVIRTQDFDLDVLQRRTTSFAQRLNDYEFGNVDVTILGDIIESLTGLNHINSWQSMQAEIYEGNAIIFAYEVLRDMLSRVRNLRNVYIISGNHDRASRRNDQDVHGTVAKAVAYFLGRDFSVEFHPLVISEQIDNINYVLTHGHFGFSKKDLTKILYDYGKQGMYNVLMGAHKHTRSSKKPIKMDEAVPIDEVNYRAIRVAPFFTGNFYSESIGHTSTAGFSVTFATENKKNIEHHDIALR